MHDWAASIIYEFEAWFRVVPWDMGACVFFLSSSSRAFKWGRWPDENKGTKWKRDGDNESDGKEDVVKEAVSKKLKYVWNNEEKEWEEDEDEAEDEVKVEELDEEAGSEDNKRRNGHRWEDLQREW